MAYLPKKLLHSTDYTGETPTAEKSKLYTGCSCYSGERSYVEDHGSKISITANLYSNNNPLIFGEPNLERSFFANIFYRKVVAIIIFQPKTRILSISA